ncbi:Amelotin [Fukomys damarensis]|uniref:Amelotin n=1 Tax=Fukomys damarensis TaxID=885580 RepID=A0A091DJ37_FUKDA|nr:Amelotin [Fukomys damarensis]
MKISLIAPQLTPAPGAAPGAQKLPLTLGALNGQNQLQQVLPIFVTQVGAQPLGSQFFTGLLLHTLFPGGILPTSQVGANPDAQDGALPVGQAGANANIQATPEGHLSTPGVTDDDFEATTPAGIQRATHTTKGITTGSPNDAQPPLAVVGTLMLQITPPPSGELLNINTHC